MNIIYSFNKKGFEAEYWTREIAVASNDRFTFLPFNHDPYLNPNMYIRAQLLDNLYYQQHPGLMRMYADFESIIKANKAEAVIVDTCPPYHPDFLRYIPIYKVLRIADGPMSAYDRDFAYLHAYDHVFYHSPAYSRDMGMSEKLMYVGAKNIDLWMLALFEAMFDHTKTGKNILEGKRDIDVIFVGALHVGKMPLLAKVKKALGDRMKICGLSSLKRNLYFNAKYGFPGWVRPIKFTAYVPLYQRSKIGINVHNRGDYTVGGYRLFELPGNGVMQISDGGEYLSAFYKVGDKVIGYKDVDDLIDKVRYYLDHDDERRRIALNGYRRVMADHTFASRMQRAGEMIEQGMRRIEWKGRAFGTPVKKVTKQCSIKFGTR